VTAGPGQEALRRLDAVSGAIPRILRRHPDLLERLDEAPLSRARLVEQALAAAAAVQTEPDPEAAIRRSLRRIKYVVVGQLILRDLDGELAAVAEVTRTLAWLADALCEGAIRFADARLAARHGRPPGWPDEGGFVAVALGKHGGEELNYSSDIDVIWFVVDHDGETGGPRPIATRRYAERLAAEVAAILATPTADGFCFRVDLALRPDGLAGAPVPSLAAAEQYYLTWGRTWERAAWLKARPCAGDLELGEELLRRIAPFRFRRSMDFGTLRDLAAMRDRISAAARAGSLEADLKRGPGGIREVEFLVQARQLIWAGREPSLRVRGTLEALPLLAEHGVLTDEVAARLGEAYRFLRFVEHRLMWPQEAQTQRLPARSDTDGWERLALAAGRTVEVLRSELAAHRDVIHDAWSGLLQDAGAPTPERTVLSDPFATAAERRAELERLGFNDPADADRRLSDLARPSARERMSPAAWRRFEQVLPQLVELAGVSGDPDAALTRLQAFVGRAGARGTTYALLAENPRVSETLIRLFAGSAFLSELLCAHPELLDALVLRGRGGERPCAPLDELWSRLVPQLEARPEADDALLALRTFQVAELLRIGLSDLGDALPDDALPSRWLTDLARACVRGAHLLATREMQRRHGPLADAGGLAVVGMGSLGSGWMTYGSDLDLVFLYDPGAAGASSSGPRPLDPSSWAARWSQRVITSLSAPTRQGSCYGVDMRLRPDGIQGPLVVPLSGFVDYYRERARPWERIALCRGAIASCPGTGLAERLADVLAVARCPGGLVPADVVAGASAMRDRQRAALPPAEPGSVDLKKGRGGLTDVEFAVACFQVTRRSGHPATRIADPMLAMDALSRSSDIRGAAAGELAEAYRFVRRVEARLRLGSGRGVEVLRFGSPVAERVAASIGLGSADRLQRELAVRTRTIERRTDELLRHVAAGRGGS
jgi:[glutamine synthetase] adenylyltransferase / [glutamine synthetase]-adenylyl-L-tyrosine phosphorylase